MKDNGALNSSGISGGSASGGISGGGMSERDEISARICDGLGGRDNISDVDCCATRLRCTVYQSSKVKTDVLKSTGASGVIQKGQWGTGHLRPESNRYQIPSGRLSGENAGGRKPGSQPRQLKRNQKHPLSPVLIRELVADIHKAPDEGFASGAVGDGAFVELTGPDIVAPADGTVSFVFDTRHALGFKTLSGIALLIHVGIDTVS